MGRLLDMDRRLGTLLDISENSLSATYHEPHLEGSMRLKSRLPGLCLGPQEAPRTSVIDPLRPATFERLRTNPRRPC